MRYRYLCIRELSFPDANAPFYTYGVQCLCETETGCVQAAVFHDVSVERDFTERLCCICTAEQLAPCHFLDVLYDWLP